MTLFRSNLVRALVAFAALLAGGYAAAGPVFTEFQPIHAGKAELIVYRPNHFLAGARSRNILLNGTKVADD